MSSKLRKLKQQAYEAGRKRDWAAAADAYAQILEHDKNNPSLQNEFGDVCLKMGDTTKAIRQFLSAAAKYRQTGLLSNAQAVYKKVLRHEAGNLNANWYLAEIRSAQGLVAEGVQHALTFLAAANDVSGEIKEIFLKRCLELFVLYAESDQVLERVEGIFRLRNMPLEQARAGCLRACLAHRGGDTAAAAEAVAKLVAAVPEIKNYAEYTRWLEQSGQKPRAGGFADFNAIQLDAAQKPAAPTPAPLAASAAPTESGDVQVDGPLAAIDAESDQTAEPEVPAPRDVRSDPAVPSADVERDDDGCITIDVGGETSFSDLLAEAASAVPQPAAAPQGGLVNLLQEILAEEGEDILRSSETEQVSTIASEIGRNLGEQQDQDPETLYQQGLVYLEMGLHEQATMSFAGAARDAGFRLRAREMWGIALHRAHQHDAALAVLQEGLAGVADGQALGLLYHAGRILEELGREDEAQEHYRRVHVCDAGFADVIQRLRLPVV